jgi:hypothetical protein
MERHSFTVEIGETFWPITGTTERVDVEVVPSMLTEDVLHDSESDGTLTACDPDRVHDNFLNKISDHKMSISRMILRVCSSSVSRGITILDIL